MSDPRGGNGRVPASRPRQQDSVRRFTLFLLDATVVVITFLLLRAFLLYVRAPVHPARFAELAAALGLMTAAAMLMLLLSLNASFFPVLKRRTAALLTAVAWTTAVGGVVLSVGLGGGTATRYAGYLVVGALAFVFITVQEARIAKARAQGAPGQQPDRPSSGRSQTAAPAATKPRVRSKQRRGGRKR